MKNLERVMKALANGRRMNIVRYLGKHKGATVGDIAASIKLSFKATSKHLAILYAAELIDREQSSILVKYFLPAKPHPLVKFISNSRE
jgi:DNA-binding transcriptional ArsR family regulator